MRDVTAFAPATVGNAAVGFDVLGFAVDAVGDDVTVRLVDEPGVRIVAIHGVTTDLPSDATQNTAGVGLLRMIETHGRGGFDVSIRKGIPLGSGLGGSAASAVAAVVAGNAALGGPFSPAELFEFALAGEAVASGHAHPDNVAPCLYGGVTYATRADGVSELPAPPLWVALVHPHLRVDTRAAREVLPAVVSIETAVQQMGHLTSFVDACHRRDGGLAARHCVDLVAEPHRKSLVTGFDDARRAALDAGAPAFSLSGSGPTVWAPALSPDAARDIVAAVVAAFEQHGVRSDAWISPFGATGARLVEEKA